MQQFLSGKKTYILVVLGAVGVIVHWLSGDLTFAQFLGTDEFTALIGLFGLGTLRAGVAKSTEVK